MPAGLLDDETSKMTTFGSRLTEELTFSNLKTRLRDSSNCSCGRAEGRRITSIMMKTVDELDAGSRVFYERARQKLALSLIFAAIVRRMHPRVPFPTSPQSSYPQFPLPYRP